MFDCVFTSGRLKNLFCYQVDKKFSFFETDASWIENFSLRIFHREKKNSGFYCVNSHDWRDGTIFLSAKNLISCGLYHFYELHEFLNKS